MFTPASAQIRDFAENNPKRIKELENLFVGNTNVYIDWANVYRWQGRLKWKIHQRKIRELYASFDNVSVPKIYFGTDNTSQSEKTAEDLKRWGYDFRTKPVKHMRISINVSSVPSDSVDILRNLVRQPLLSSLKVSTIESLNKELGVLNSQGILHLEDLKCNFDVEIGRDMLLDFERGGVDTYVLWSGDSDFADPIKQLLQDGKRVILFMTANKVATELSELREMGLKMFEINKVRDAICRDSYLTTS